MATDPMNIQEVRDKVKLKIVHAGNESSYTLSNIKLEATDEAIYTTGTAIGKLRRAPLDYVSKVIDYSISSKN